MRVLGVIKLLAAMSEIVGRGRIGEVLEARAAIVYDLLQRDAVDRIRCLTPMLQPEEPGATVEFITEAGTSIEVLARSGLVNLWPNGKDPGEVTHVQADGDLIRLWTNAGEFTGNVAWPIWVEDPMGQRWEV